jgi:predicted Zn-dependent peptidase
MPAERAVTSEPAQYVGGDRRQQRELEQLHLVIGFPGLPLGDPDYYAASVLSTAFGGGMSSRLFQEVREKRGLVYSIHSFAHGYRDGGLFGIYAGTGEEEAAELLPVLCEETARLAEGFAPAELARAKAQMKAGLLMSLESTGARCEQMAQHMLIHGTPFDPADMVRRIDAVDNAAIARVVAGWHSAPPTLTALGPIGRLEDFDRLKARLAA